MNKQPKNKLAAGLAALTFLALLATMKILIVGLLSDEEYAVSMAYRLAQGEKLFLDLWDPHQMSAFACRWLISLYLAVTHSVDGLILFLRVCGIGIQLALSLFVYRTLRLRYQPAVSYFCSLLVFILLPKYIQLPEFSNLMLWSELMVSMLLLRCGLDPHPIKNPLRLVIAAAFYCCMILAYPTALLLVPCYAILLWKLWETNPSQNQAAKHVLPLLIFFGTCCVIGMIYLFSLFSYLTLPELLAGISHMASDGSHAAGAGSRVLFYLSEIASLLLVSLPPFIIALLILLPVTIKELQKDAQTSPAPAALLSAVLRRPAFLELVILLACLEQALIWLLGSHYINRPLAFFYLIGAAAFFLPKNNQTQKSLFSICVIPSWLAVLAVLILTNTTIGFSGAFLLPAIIASLLLLQEQAADQNRTPEQSQTASQGKKDFSSLLTPLSMLAFIGILLFSKGFLVCLDEGVKDHVFLTRQKILYGPGKYIYSDYVNGYNANVLAQIMDQYIDEADSVLYVGSHSSRILLLPGTLANASTISTPTYGEDLLTYWEAFPEKYPTLVVAEYNQFDTYLDQVRSFLPLGEELFSSPEYQIFRVAGRP